MNVMEKIRQEQCTSQHPDFQVGDTLKVHVKIVEGTTERIQVFTGLVIGRSGGDIGETFTVRRVTGGQGVERVFPLHSPRIAKIQIERRGKVRRAKLYYLREKIGKAARVKERRMDGKSGPAN